MTKRLTVAEYEETLRALEAKRAELVARGAELPEVRAQASYAAHTGNAEARKELDKVSAELATHSSELASLDDAISTAKNYVLIAQAFEAEVAQRARGKDAAAILDELKSCGRALDEAFPPNL